MRQSRFYQKVGQSTPRAAYSRKAFAFGRFRLRVCLLYLAGFARSQSGRFDGAWRASLKIMARRAPSWRKKWPRGEGELPLGPRRGFAALIDAPPLLF